MGNSNWTGKFPRTSREAFGYTVYIEEQHMGDRLVGLVAAFAAGFILAMLVFGG